MRTDDSSTAQRGFTLMEMLVALAIFAAATALYLPGIGQTLGVLAGTTERTNSLALAQSVLASIGHDIPLVDGTVESEPRPGIVLRIDIGPVDDSGGVAPAAHRVVVRAGRRGGRGVTLETVKLGPTP